MTDYCAGTEDISFSTIIGFTWGTNNPGLSYRTNFSRGFLSINLASATDPPANRIALPPFTPVGSLWAHCQYGGVSTAPSTLNATLMRVLDGSGIARIAIRTTASGQLKIDKRNAAGTFTNLVTSAVNIMPVKAIPYQVDLYVNYAVSGQVTLYIDGIVVADTGAGVDVTTDGVTTLGQVDYGCICTSFVGITECLVRDGATSTLYASVLTLPPVAAGNTQSWLPNTVANINENTLVSDATLVATSSNNALSQWTVATALPFGQWTISSVVECARVSRGATGPQHFEWLVRTSAGTDHVTGSVLPTTTFANYFNVWPQNPNTVAAWAAGELINSGIESLA